MRGVGLSGFRSIAWVVWLCVASAMALLGVAGTAALCLIAIRGSDGLDDLSWRHGRRYWRLCAYRHQLRLEAVQMSAPQTAPPHEWDTLDFDVVPIVQFQARPEPVPAKEQPLRWQVLTGAKALQRWDVPEPVKALSVKCIFMVERTTQSRGVTRVDGTWLPIEGDAFDPAFCVLWKGTRITTAWWPLLLPSGVGTIPLMACCYLIRRRRCRLVAGLCTQCGYDLRASRERCPECGRPFKGS